MTSLVRHHVRAVPTIDHGGGEDDNDESQDVPVLPAGKLLHCITTATCNGEPAVVTVFSYTFVSGGPFVDQAGYRPALGPTPAPNYLTGQLLTNDNPLSYFDIGLESAPQEVNVTAEAFRLPCGSFDASGTAQLAIPPVSIEPIDFPGNTKLGSFVISADTVFGFGTELANPGFKYEQNVEWTQAGWFGVIQLISGTYAYQVANSSDWIPIVNESTYVLDVLKDAQDPVHNMQIRPGLLKVQFTDAPNIDVKSFVELKPDAVAFSIDAQFQTYLLFNPSTTTNPTGDMTTMWYPLPGTSAVQWEISGVAQYNPSRETNKKLPDAWLITADSHEMEPLSPGQLPTWNAVIDKVSRMGINAERLSDG